VTAHVYLGHGASGNAASMKPHVDGLRKRGIAATALDLPKGNAQKAMEKILATVPIAAGDVVIGGHSYGGRVASMVAAEHPVSGLLLLSYPLHRPGHPEELKTEHWKTIRCPVLLLSGESDPFATIALLRRSVKLLRDAELFTYPRVSHGLAPVLDDALDRVAAFVKGLVSG
jgi:predicted alpha/beta-hydrolase family hydrolase